MLELATRAHLTTLTVTAIRTIPPHLSLPGSLLQDVTHRTHPTSHRQNALVHSKSASTKV